MDRVLTSEELSEIYGEPLERALWKEIDYINDLYRQFIESSPFLILATSGNKGIDCSPRGDPPGFVRVEGRDTILIPDRKGNNRLDSLNNIINNPQVGIIFLVPKVGEALRISGTAEILIDEPLCKTFEMNGKVPNSVIRIKVQKVYYQCQKAIVRSKLWNPDAYSDKRPVPTPGEMAEFFANENNQEFNGEEYDKNYPEYMKKNLY